MNEKSDFWLRLNIALIISGKRSLRELCEKIGTSYQTLINQKSQLTYPTLETAIKIAKELDCSMDWLVLGEGSIDDRLLGRKADN